MRLERRLDQIAASRNQVGVTSLARRIAEVTGLSEMELFAEAERIAAACHQQGITCGLPAQCGHVCHLRAPDRPARDSAPCRATGARDEARLRSLFRGSTARAALCPARSPCLAFADRAESCVIGGRRNRSDAGGALRAAPRPATFGLCLADRRDWRRSARGTAPPECPSLGIIVTPAGYLCPTSSGEWGMCCLPSSRPSRWPS